MTGGLNYEEGRMTGMSKSGPTAIMVEGQVTAANSHGIKLDSEADWLNYSKFSKPEDVYTPAVGSRVALTLDKSGFIRRVEALDAAKQAVQQPAQNGAAPVQQPAQAQAHTGPVLPREGLVFDRDLRITRMASINAANTYLAHNQHGYTVAELLATAEQLEAWVTR